MSSVNPYAELPCLDDMDPKKILFVHIPRTGGSALRAIIPCEADHGAWWNWKDELEFERHGFHFSFTIVRNPWEQAMSLYRIWEGGRLSFEEWVMAGCPYGRPSALKWASAWTSMPSGPAPWHLQCSGVDQMLRAGPLLDQYLRFEDRKLWWPQLTSKPDEHLGAATEPMGEHTRLTNMIIHERNAALIASYGYTPPVVDESNGGAATSPPSSDGGN